MKYFSLEKFSIVMLGITSISTIVLSAMLFTGCGYNRQIIDFNYSFNKAIIEDVGEIEIKSWTDYENSDMVQVTATDGTVYLTHSSKVILIYDK